MSYSLEGWNIGDAESMEWSPWGSGDKARAKILASGDDFYVALVEADPGYRGDGHDHAATEFLFVVSGSLRTQGRTMAAGDAYVAAAGSVHQDFGTDDGATYLSIFKL